MFARKGIQNHRNFLVGRPPVTQLLLPVRVDMHLNTEKTNKLYRVSSQGNTILWGVFYTWDHKRKQDLSHVQDLFDAHWSYTLNRPPQEFLLSVHTITCLRLRLFHNLPKKGVRIQLPRTWKEPNMLTTGTYEEALLYMFTFFWL